MAVEGPVNIPGNDDPSTRRQAMMSMAIRRAQAGTGSSAQRLRERTAAYGVPDIRKYLPGVRFAIVGGLATRLYMPERMTLDADILVLPEDRSAAETALASADGTRLGLLTVGGSSWRLPDGTEIDILALDEAWVEEAIERAVEGPGRQPYVRLPYLVLMKIAASRMQDLADVSRMLGGADSAALDDVRAFVRRYRPQDEEDLESLIHLGRLEQEH